MNGHEIRDALAAQLGLELEWHEDHAGDPFAVVPPEKWREACRVARTDERLFFDFLRAQTGTDRPAEEAIELVVHLFSYRHRHAFVLKTRVSRAEPVADSLVTVWPAADWYEREIFDLLGVRFTGHPDLRRLLLPEDWVGHPLRKDYEQPASYQGIPTTRPTPGQEEDR
jgi:NADH-quinone oxidoreductase subunit C